jgi:nucleoside-diphosphate-sugar epimerase
MSDKKVLITGGAGFIGGWLTKRLLDDGATVTLVDNLSRGVKDDMIDEFVASDRCTIETRDLSVPGALDGLGNDFTHVVHFAALLGVQNVLNRPYEVLKANVSMLETMLDFAAGQSSLERFVFPSTSEVYVGTLQHYDLPLPTPETTPLAISPLDHPRTSYMLSKIYGEALVNQAGLPFTIIRPHNFYGPRMGQSHVIPELLGKIHRLNDGDDLVIASMDHSRTFCFIDDAVEYIVRMLGDAGLNGTFNVGVQEPEITIGQLAQVLIDTVGRKVNLVPGDITPGSPSRRAPHMGHAIAATGYEPQVSLEEGVRRTYEWYLPRVFEGDGVAAV